MLTSTDKNDGQNNTQGAAADIRDGARRIKEDLSEANRKVHSDLQDFARNAGEHAREYVGTAEKSIVNAAETVTSKIQSNPLQSSLIAMGVGALLGIALFRRS